jgi:hypothetical protein
MTTGRPVHPPGETSDGAQQKVQEALSQGQETVQEAASDAKSRLREQLDQRTSQTGSQINQQASDLRAVSQSLREQGKEGPANAADNVARYVEKVGSYLQRNDSEGLLSDVEDFGRRQPWAMGAGALALGLVASRFLKASSGRRYSARYAQASGPDPVRQGTAATPPPSEPVSAAPEPPSLAGASAIDLGIPLDASPVGRTSRV